MELETIEKKELVISDTAQAAVVARETAQIQSAVISAKKFPRDENESYTRAIRAFKRESLAKNATYEFPRGGKKVSGASIDCARELAKAWGNIRWGFEVTESTADQVSLRGFAIDLESNTTVEMGDRFEKLVQRKINNVTSWVKPDERDLRELVNRRGAILVRNCLLQLIPSDVTEAVLDQARSTLKASAEKTLKSSREDVIRQLVLSFAEVGVKNTHLKTYLGKDVSEIDVDELVSLRGIYKSLRDGHTRISDHFEVGKATKKAAEESEELNAVLEKIGDKKDENN